MKHIYRRFILSAVLVFPVVISAGAQELAGDNASSLQNDSCRWLSERFLRTIY